MDSEEPADEIRIDSDDFMRWMDTEGLPGTGLTPDHDLISGGTQNHIFQIGRGDFSAVLRVPPATAPAKRDEGILREWRILEALNGTDVPHPEAIAVCRDRRVIGRPFYLMGYVDGWCVANTDGWWAPPFDTDIEGRRGLAYELIDGIVQLGNVDWQARGLGDLGRPEGYHERQVERWSSFYEQVKSREIPGLDVVTSWLGTHRPIDFVPGIMQGDYHFPNVMFRHGAPARLAAILDWEMGTVGDPKLDLAWTLHMWPDDPAAPPSGQEHFAGLPSRPQLLGFYEERSGRQVDDFDYYMILAKWKLAIVLEPSYRRAGDNKRLQEFGPFVLELMKSAADLAESTGYSGIR